MTRSMGCRARLCAALSALSFAAVAAAGAETGLESLWKTGKSRGSRNITAELDVRQAESVLRHKGALYPVSLSASARSEFNDVQKESAWYAADAGADISVSKPLPGGMKATAAIAYALNREFLPATDGYMHQELAYRHIPSAALSVSQSLRPFWLQGTLTDPNTALLRTSLEQKRISLEAADKSLVLSITEQYIQFRKNERLAAAAQKKLAFYDETVQALQESFAAGENTAADVWRADEERWNCRQNLDGYLKKRQDAYESLRLSCGSVPQEMLMGTLPQNTFPLFADDIAGRLLRSQLSQLQSSTVLEKQESAPALALKGSVAECGNGKKQNLGWSFSVALDFSNFSLSRGKLRKEQYQHSRTKLEAQLEESRLVQEKNRQLYAGLVQTYQEKVQESEELCGQRKRYAEAVQQEFAAGGCSRLDVLSAWNEYEAAVCMQENDRDLLWYYTWLGTQNN